MNKREEFLKAGQAKTDALMSAFDMLREAIMPAVEAFNDGMQKWIELEARAHGMTVEEYLGSLDSLPPEIEEEPIQYPPGSFKWNGIQFIRIVQRRDAEGT